MAVSPKSFLVLEKSLHKRIQRNWRKVKSRLVAQLLLKFKDDDHTAINKLVGEIKLEEAVLHDLKYVKFVGKQAMLFGASRITPPKDSELLKQKKIGPVVDKATTQLIMILTDSSKKVRRRVEELIGSEFHDRTVIAKAEIIKAFVSALTDAVTSEDSLHLAASLHTSRLAVMGTLIESVAQSRKTTIWNAVLDARTCPICASQDQRVFSVEIIWERMTRAIEADTVEDLKRLSPWPPQTKEGIESFQAMTTSELQMAGYDSPPMHPLCRCFLDVTEQPMEVIETNISAVDFDRFGTGDLFNEVRINPFTPATTVKEAEEWAMANIAQAAKYEGMDLEVINEVNKTLHDIVVVNRYPKLTSISTSPVDRSSYASAMGNQISLNKNMFKASNFVGDESWTPMKIILEKDILSAERRLAIRLENLPTDAISTDVRVQRYKDTIAAKKKALAKGPTVSYAVNANRGPVGNIVAHEYGHTAENRAVGRLITGDEATDKDMDAIRAFIYNRDTLLGGADNRVMFMNTLSEYSGVDVNETIAEAWSAYHSPLRATIPDVLLGYIESLIKGDLL